MIPVELLAMLRCPESRQPLLPAPAGFLAELESLRVAGQLRKCSGQALIDPVQDGLLRRDRKRFYLVRDGIPILIAHEGIDV